MMHRRRRHRALKWTLWIVGIIGFAVVALALIKIDDVVMAQGIAEPGQKIYIDSPLKRVVHQILCYPGTPVKIGQPVARLYDADLRATAAAAEKERGAHDGRGKEGWGRRRRRQGSVPA